MYRHARPLSLPPPPLCPKPGAGRDGPEVERDSQSRPLNKGGQSALNEVDPSKERSNRTPKLEPSFDSLRGGGRRLAF